MDSVQSSAIEATLLHAVKANNLDLLRELVKSSDITKSDVVAAIFCTVDLNHLEAFSFLLPLVEHDACFVFDLADALIKASRFSFMDFFIAQPDLLCWSEMMDLAFDLAKVDVVQHLMPKYPHSREELDDLALESLTDSPPSFAVFDHFLSHYGLDCNTLLLKAVDGGFNYLMPNFFEWDKSCGRLNVVEVLSRVSLEGDKSSYFLEALCQLVDAVCLKLDSLEPEERTRVDALLDRANPLTI